MKPCAECGDLTPLDSLVNGCLLRLRGTVMFKNFEIKFDTNTQFLIGWSTDMTGTQSRIHSFYFGPWTLTVVLHGE